MIITGIGSRKIDAKAFNSLHQIAVKLAKLGWWLRSGGADGSDSAWELGWQGFDTKEIFLPNVGFNGRPKNDACYLTPADYDVWIDAEDIARQLHPVFDRLTEWERAAHTRNVFQVLGKDLKSRSDVVAAYAPPKGKSVTGGTATAFNLAKARGIPTYNLWLKEQRQEFFEFVHATLGGAYENPVNSRSAIPDDLTAFM
jgi:hypothetical protein